MGLFLTELCLAGAPGASLAAADARAEAEIQAQLRRWTRAYEAKDMDALMVAAAPEAVVEVLGPLDLAAGPDARASVRPWPSPPWRSR